MLFHAHQDSDCVCDRASPLMLSLGFLQKDLRAPDIIIGADTIVVSPASSSVCTSLVTKVQV